MLKIRRLSGKGQVLTIKLEGELLEPGVGAVFDACTHMVGWPSRLVLDLAAVTYVDGPGVQLLRDLVAVGIEVGACSSFVAALLGLEGC
jgi:hypothetical protein